MAPYEALYVRRCRYPVSWFEVGEVALIGPDSVHEAMEKVQLIRNRLKKSQSCQKSYVDVRRRDLEFEIDDWIFSEVELAAVHPVLHISLLKKCVGYPTSIVPLESVVVNDSLTYEGVPVEILDHPICRFRNKEVALVKVLWRSQSVEGATWEAEAAMMAKYPHLFPSDSISASSNSSSRVS
ncbi:hypothetical protein MTR67_002326 [Solanum verrucosum]|uniref:Uncharacterized protein n=1 Tax=Solanum verrucosum TaxID=315347 RepID=A0AAF0PQN9_SOLVR|nr:hypothetical protein MTR67_002326 [Solanum verrucosum]